MAQGWMSIKYSHYDADFLKSTLRLSAIAYRKSITFCIHKHTKQIIILFFPGVGVYSMVLNRRRGTLIKFLAIFQPLPSYSIPYVY